MINYVSLNIFQLSHCLARREDPTHPTRSFRTVLLKAKLEQGEKRSIPSITRSFRTVLLRAKLEQGEKRSNPFIIRSFRTALLQARLEQVEKRSIPSYQDFRNAAPSIRYLEHIPVSLIQP